MMTVANHLNKPFLKIDPLKLDYEVVTQVISKPYAIKHQIVPIALSENLLTVATGYNLLTGKRLTGFIGAPDTRSILS